MVAKAAHNISFNSSRSLNSNMNKSETSHQKAENLGCRSDYWEKQKMYISSLLDPANAVAAEDDEELEK